MRRLPPLILPGKGKNFVSGGENEKGSLDFVDSFDTNKESWKTEENMTETRCGAAAYVQGGKMFVTGGSNVKKCCSSVESLHCNESSGWVKTEIIMTRPCIGQSVVFTKTQLS